MLLVDHRENPKLIHKLLVKMGDADNDPKGQARVLSMKSGDYVIGDWGIEAKEINDLYRSILGIGRSRTIVGQLKDLCETFERPFLVVYNTELKPWFHGRRPSAKELSEERKKMAAVINSFKMTMHQRFPNLHFLTIFPDSDDAEFMLKLEGKRNTEIYCGLTQGVAVYEKINKRSITAMEKKLNNSVHGIMTQEWPIKWNEYFCTQWCDFHLSCNEELIGVDNNEL